MKMEVRDQEARRSGADRTPGDVIRSSPESMIGVDGVTTRAVVVTTAHDHTCAPRKGRPEPVVCILPAFYRAITVARGSYRVTHYTPGGTFAWPSRAATLLFAEIYRICAEGAADPIRGRRGQKITAEVPAGPGVAEFRLKKCCILTTVWYNIGHARGRGGLSLRARCSLTSEDAVAAKPGAAALRPCRLTFGSMRVQHRRDETA